MKRDLAQLSDRQFDLVVVGGGIFGACAARDAAQRGLSVAMIDRGDFCDATSAHSYKLIHGGIRYLQHGDLYRIRQSSAERRAMLRIAPHLVHPLPIVIPTYGHGLRGKALLRLGLGLYDLATWDRNRGIQDSQRRVPAGRFISRQEVLQMYPSLPSKGLSGAGIFCDGQMYNPPRLVLAFVQSAVQDGAVAANYVQATGLLQRAGRVCGVEAQDQLTGRELEIRGRYVLNAAGPYAEGLLAKALGLRLSPPGAYSRDACFLVAGRLTGDCGLAVSAATSDPDAVLSRGTRHLFVVPWRQYSIVGVWHTVYEGDPNRFTVTDQELQIFIDELNNGYPGLRLTLDDVLMWNAGLVPFGQNKPGAKDLSYGHRSRLVDHAQVHGLHGLVTLIGVRYTTGRYEAARAVDLIVKRLGRKTPGCRTGVTQVYGGHIDQGMETFLRDAVSRGPADLSTEVMRSLTRNYGTAYQQVLDCASQEDRLLATIAGSTTIGAQVTYAVRHEMAQTLSDVVRRRTDLATGQYPGREALSECARLMARELGWDDRRTQQEVANTAEAFPANIRVAKNPKGPTEDRPSSSPNPP